MVGEPQAGETAQDAPAGTGGPVRAVPPWFKIFPFVLSALFFFSFVFALFAPVPLLVLHARGGFKALFLAVLTNTAVTWLLGGPASAAIYFISIGLLSLVLPYFMFERRWLPDRAIFAALLTMLVVGGAGMTGYFLAKHQAPGPAFHKALQTTVDRVVTMSAPDPGMMGDVTVDELKQNLIDEFPSLVVVFGLLLAWINTLLLTRLQPFKTRERLGIDATYFKRWKAPEWLIWPVIAVGVGVVFAHGQGHTLALNAFKFLMVIYGLQGLSILAYVLDIFRIRGLFRTLIYLTATLFMTPILIGIGFFDLWFDFRSKFRQS
jgi:uncharacterized protein YybS (DUF2232 family)